MDDLLLRTKSQLRSVPNSLAKLERTLSTRQSLNDDKGVMLDLMEAELLDTLDQIGKNCEAMNDRLFEISASKRVQMRLNVDQIRYECKQLRSSFETMQRRRAMAEEHLRNREMLLNVDLTPNSAAYNRHGAEKDATVLQLDAEIDHHNRLSSVGSSMDQMIAMAQANLTSLREQGFSLKASRRRILQVAKTLSLSNTVMRLIERRSKEDKILFWALAAGSLIFMYAIWTFLKA